MANICSTLKGKLGTLSDEQLVEDLAAVKAERRQFSRTTGPLREDAHANLDRLVAGFRARLADQFKEGVPADIPTGQWLDDVSRLAAVSSSDVEKQVRAAIDASALSEMPRAEYEKRVGDLRRREVELELELERRRVQ